MPNHVYSVISLPTLTKNQKGILEKIEQAGGLCRYYKPMPKELEGIISGSLKIDGKSVRNWRDVDGKNVAVSEKELKQLEEKYGASNWYNWCLNEWNSKWGCYDFIVDDEVIYFTSAWSPIGENIIEMFAKDFPDFVYSWEEEQEDGAEMEYSNGEFINRNEYDMPEWEEVKELEDGSTITELINEHPNYDDGVGYYLDYSREFLGKNLEEIEIN